VGTLLHLQFVIAVVVTVNAALVLLCHYYLVSVISLLLVKLQYCPRNGVLLLLVVFYL